jgi:hypothetical protein
VSPHSLASTVDNVASPYSVASPYPASLADAGGNGRRGRPRKHAPKIPLPPIYVFIRNLLYNRSRNDPKNIFVTTAFISPFSKHTQCILSHFLHKSIAMFH